MKTPSIKVLITLILVVSLLITVISKSSYGEEPKDELEKYQENNLQIGVEIENNENNKDSDSDGLNDWEEILWGTDINNPDSDEDGTKDGTEVVLGRNPNKPGPDDLTVKADGFKEDPIKIESNIKPNTLTARTSVELAKQVFDAQYGDGEISIDKVVDQAQSEIKISDKYNVDNMLTISNPTQEDIREYGNNFASIYKDEILKMSSSQDKSVAMFVAGYKNIALRMSTIRVPQEISGIHTDFINNIDQAASILLVIRDSNDDPVKSFLLLPKYNEASDKIATLQKQIKSYFDNNNIIFNEEDPGYVLFGGKTTE